jgi:hypothetical protein
VAVLAGFGRFWPVLACLGVFGDVRTVCEKPLFADTRESQCLTKETARDHRLNQKRFLVSRHDTDSEKVLPKRTLLGECAP